MGYSPRSWSASGGYQRRGGGRATRANHGFVAPGALKKETGTSCHCLRCPAEYIAELSRASAHKDCRAACHWGRPPAAGDKISASRTLHLQAVAFELLYRVSSRCKEARLWQVSELPPGKDGGSRAIAPWSTLTQRVRRPWSFRPAASDGLIGGASSWGIAPRQESNDSGAREPDKRSRFLEGGAEYTPGTLRHGCEREVAGEIDHGGLIACGGRTQSPPVAEHGVEPRALREAVVTDEVAGGSYF